MEGKGGWDVRWEMGGLGEWDDGGGGGSGG